MEYCITHEALIELVKEEVSRIADRAYAEDGTSLYDAIRIIDKDLSTIKRMIADASSVILERFRDYLVAPASGTVVSSETFNFHLPDMAEEQEPIAKAELQRFLSLQVVALWLRERYAQEYESYLERATTALDKAARALFTRKRVTR